MSMRSLNIFTRTLIGSFRFHDENKIIFFSVFHNILPQIFAILLILGCFFIQCDSRYYLYEIFVPYVFKMSIAIH